MSALRALALFAHPDDAEFLCAGTLALLADRGASIHIATLTAGDAGTVQFYPRQKSLASAAREAQRAAAILHAEYTCLEERDLLVMYDARTLRKVMELVRAVDPTVVFTHAPHDYMVDHETAAASARLPVLAFRRLIFPRAPGSLPSPLAPFPISITPNPSGTVAIVGEEILPHIVADISGTLDRKEKMLACHESQRAWMSFQQSVTQLDDPLRQMAARCGKLAGFTWGEGFRQHLGQGFPQDNLLGDLLKDLVRPVRQ